MAETERKVFRYKCSSCDEWHEGAPSFAFDAPHYYEMLSLEARDQHAHLDSDFCIIDRLPDDAGADYFIRCLLEIPIRDADEPFLWGVWSSVSEKNFRHYEERFDKPPEPGVDYFGWFSNNLPGYPPTLSLKCRVLPQDGARPLLDLQATDHPLSVHYHHGISMDEALLIAEKAMHGGKDG